MDSPLARADALTPPPAIGATQAVRNKALGFSCLSCGERGTRVIDSTPYDYTITRRRQCQCGARFTTMEVEAQALNAVSTARSLERLSAKDFAMVRDLVERLAG